MDHHTAALAGTPNCLPPRMPLPTFNPDYTTWPRGYEVRPMSLWDYITLPAQCHDSPPDPHKRIWLFSGRDKLNWNTVPEHLCNLRSYLGVGGVTLDDIQVSHISIRLDGSLEDTSTVLSRGVVSGWGNHKRYYHAPLVLMRPAAPNYLEDTMTPWNVEVGLVVAVSLSFSGEEKLVLNDPVTLRVRISGSLFGRMW